MQIFSFAQNNNEISAVTNIYPNPINEQNILNIRLYEACSLTIVNQNGTTIDFIPFSENPKFSIRTNEWDTGMYSAIFTSVENNTYQIINLIKP